MTTRNLFFGVLACLAVSVVSCTSDEFEGAAPVDGSISFIKQEAPMMTRSATRGTLSTLSSITTFGVSTAIYNADQTYATAGCGSYFRNLEVDAETGSTTYLWPASTYRVSFYAYTPYNSATLSSAETVGKMRYTYTVPDAVADHVDFMTAEVLDQSCPSPDPVELTFGHRLSDFSFRLENSTSDDVTVNSITVMNFDHTGTLVGDTWTTTGVSKNITLTVGTPLASGSSMDLTGTDNHFLLIPQTLTSGTRLLDLYVTKGGENKHFYSDLSQAFVAEAGKSYQFTLRLSSSLQVSDGTTIDDWVLYVGYINYATGTTADDWDPEEQPIEHVVSGGISNWEQQN